MSNQMLNCLESKNIPIFNLKHDTSNVDLITIRNVLKQNGIVVLKNYYSKEEVVSMKEEIKKFDEKFVKTKNVENCSGDFRLFHVERYSALLQRLVSNNDLFNKIASFYKDPRHFNKKLLLNKLVYDAENITSSGGGWHRDNHHCQFKTLVYMSDVELGNGNFQFIVNSTIKDIGIPPHWSYNDTRYADETIDDLLRDNTNDCKLYDIIGEAGTVVFFDATNIHRGKVIEKGERVALTQYYFT
jgi:hypothetical protein